jgi:hypothetical protein
MLGDSWPRGAADFGDVPMVEGSQKRGAARIKLKTEPRA